MAAPTLTAVSDNDLVQTTIRDLGKMRYTDLSSNLQEHTAMQSLLNRNRVIIESGYGIQFDVKIAQTGAAKNTGLFGQDEIAVKDTMKPGARAVVEQLHRQNMKTFLVTGDNALTAASIACMHNFFAHFLTISGKKRRATPFITASQPKIVITTCQLCAQTS